MKQGDYGTKLYFTIKDENDEPLILAGATSIKLLMTYGDAVEERDCQIEDINGGQVSYIVQEGDLDESGRINMEVEVMYGETQRYTSNRIKETIEKRLKTT